MVHNPATLYDYLWPDDPSRPVVPVRVGMNRRTGKIMIGEKHEDQSVQIIFATPLHTRILRRWVGSFVPSILGDTFLRRVLMRFWWAIFIALDFWEPNVRVTDIRVQSRKDGSELTSAEEVRRGELTVQMSVTRRPRGHLGDDSVELPRQVGLIGLGHGRWESI